MAMPLLEEPPSSSPLSSLTEPKTDQPHTRRATLRDARAIHQLIDSFTSDGTLLPRSYNEISQNIHTFTVAETISGQFLGCASLHVYSSHFAEIRSVAVHRDTMRKGAGSLLIHALLDQAEASGIKCVCLFTRVPAFFERLHLRIVDRQNFQDKIMKDCIHCPRHHACDETAMFFGELPQSGLTAGTFFRSTTATNLVQLQL
ncbi:MAG TPA: GNAT family N-acetyltransferase [Edaphobacter sp.]|nr:GNAT family N-acetyltransferase [Edaphobacter sp.]